MNERRSTYFIFQGLLTIVLLLFYFFRREQIEDWPIRLFGLASIATALLAALAIAPAAWLENPKAQAGWFVVDILMASITLYWIQQPTSDLYLAYFLVIFGTAITHSMTQSFLVAFLATILYYYLSWNTPGTTPQEFWLRLPFLWIVASLTGILSRDAHDAQQKQENNYRERLGHLERLAVLGQVAAEIAHRIKAPLTTIRVNAEVLEHQKDIPARRKTELVRIQHEVDHCKDVLQQLLTLGRIEEMSFTPMDLSTMVRQLLDGMDAQLKQNKIHLLTRGLEQTVSIQADTGLLGEAITAILQNAVEAMPTGGKLEVALECGSRIQWWKGKRRNEERYSLVISDNGQGIASHQKETIFRPFYTTKQGSGSGLGLSSALRILDKHGGTIHAESDGPGHGSRFTLVIPNTPSVSVAQAA